MFFWILALKPVDKCSSTKTAMHHTTVKLVNNLNTTVQLPINRKTKVILVQLSIVPLGLLMEL